MGIAPHELRRAWAAPGRTARAALTALVLALGVVIAVGALDVAGRLDDLDSRRQAAASETRDPAGPAGDDAEIFRRVRDVLRPGTRFALVFGPDVNRDQRGFYRLFSGYFLYPAIAVAEPSRADAVLVFDSPAAAVRGSFEPVLEAPGVWLGRRRVP